MKLERIEIKEKKKIMRIGIKMDKKMVEMIKNVNKERRKKVLREIRI